MKITLEYLQGLNACSDGVRYWESLNLTDPVEVIRACIRDEKWGYGRWLMARMLSRKDKIAWAVFAAEQVIEIYEKRYPDKKAPLAAIDAAKAVIENQESREAARVARWAADAAAAADDAAADAATYAAATYAAAAYATYAAAAADADYAAYADYAATYAAAAYAAYAAAAADATYAAADAADACREMRVRILEYGITLFQKAEQAVLAQ